MRVWYCDIKFLSYKTNVFLLQHTHSSKGCNHGLCNSQTCQNVEGTEHGMNDITFLEFLKCFSQITISALWSCFPTATSQNTQNNISLLTLNQRYSIFLGNPCLTSMFCGRKPFIRHRTWHTDNWKHAVFISRFQWINEEILPFKCFSRICHSQTDKPMCLWTIYTSRFTSSGTMIHILFKATF